MTALPLTPGQQTAYDALMAFLMGKTEHSLAVLEGYAGTGKTFLVGRLLADLTAEDLDCRIAVAAPTNKAVRVLKDKLLEAGATLAALGEVEGRIRRRRPDAGCTCRSIHAFLGLKLKEQENGQQDAIPDGESTLRDYEIVIVDECSMIDEGIFKKITLERGQARILFVGDPAQLPPVKSAEAMISPVFSRVDYTLRLSEVVRQAKDNPIIRLSITLRQLIEADIKADALALMNALPPIKDSPKAAIVAGTRKTLIDYWLDQHQDAPETDTRIIAYTNQRVQDYNQAIHQLLYSTLDRDLLFAPGERVIVHTQCDALKVVDASLGLYQSGVLITSEELTVQHVTLEPHPLYPDLKANKVQLRDAFGGEWVVYVAVSLADHAMAVNQAFAEWRQCKAQMQEASDPKDHQRWKERAAEASKKGWALKKAFAPLRHAYAITAHKSQGSTFDCALVDFSDLAKMPDAFSFNRALYVAATRSREFLALVLT